MSDIWWCSGWFRSLNGQQQENIQDRYTPGEGPNWWDLRHFIWALSCSSLREIRRLCRRKSSINFWLSLAVLVMANPQNKISSQLETENMKKINLHSKKSTIYRDLNVWNSLKKIINFHVRNWRRDPESLPGKDLESTYNAASSEQQRS